MSAFESHIENGVAVISEVDPALVSDVVGDASLWKQYEGDDWLLPVQRALSNWAENVVHDSSRDSRELFQRNKYVTPGQVFKQMTVADEAMDDDVVGGVYDTSEAMALKKMSIESSDPEQNNIWNQIAADLNFDDYLRIIWRELFKYSQYYGIVWWGKKTYKVKMQETERADPVMQMNPDDPINQPQMPAKTMPTKKPKKRKTFDIMCPIGLGVLDPTRVVPVNFDLFGNCDHAWIATVEEFKNIVGNNDDLENPLGRTQTDDLVRQLFKGKYTPTEAEKKKLATEGIPVDRLILLNPDNVWGGHLTKASYERWARLRMKSIFPLLDMKHQLREMDRAFLLGGINFIVLVKKGTDTHPVTKHSEVTMVAEQMKTQAKSSVIVSDHRLEIEIITPDLTHILDADKWGTLDDRIRLRLWGSIAPPGSTGTSENQITLAKVVSLGLANRRHMLKRDFERRVFKATADKNKEVFDADASLEYSPRRIDLLFDSAVASNFMELRKGGDLSRETILDEFGFDQELEAQRRQHEFESGLDDIFSPVQVPFDSPAKIGPTDPGKRPGDQKPGSDPKPALPPRAG